MLPWLAALVALAVAASGFGTRFGAWDYRAGFAILRYATYAGFAVAGIALVVLCVPRARAGRAVSAALTLVVALGAAAVPLLLLYQARGLPSINDITTDTESPPEYVAIVPLRAGFPVPATYPGAEAAKAQRASYPDIAPVDLAKPPAAAFAAALATARDMGWNIIATDENAGRIEAVATTVWFGFKDDVVIRVSPTRSGSRVDIRSHSRVGRGDLGVNARRIREFAAKLNRAA